MILLQGDLEMTEKRFRVEKQIFDGYCIVDNHFEGYYAYEKQDLEKLCETLNDLNDENEKLKKDCSNLIDDNTEYVAEINQMHKENGQLKSYTGEMEDYLARLEEKNEQLKQENSVFEGKDAKHYQRWVKQIKKYVEETNTDFTYDDDFIIKIALSYTLQSLRNGESLKRFQWDYEELGE